MEKYTVLKDTLGNVQFIVRNDIYKSYIPVCEGNMDYQQYLEDLETRGSPYPEEIVG